MEVKFDEEKFVLSETTKMGVKIFMLNFLKDIETMRGYDKTCWTWGLATFGDFSSVKALDFEWGGEDYIPVHIEENQIIVFR